ncbi:mediator complex subunit MED14 [Ancylostoma caninum]|uniref:Mediator of RNA polymerase II transcription subunit 14 n=1 Tax=Ancylostoma caninum TaxID=29170 RepID=A0A368FEX2_ANCCA|nr:mediator complex subunit MED14 [Ancylostoma caninum]
MDDVDHSKPALPVVPDKCGPPTISLNYLLDFAIQQIYHEITVLSELLPKKLDGDRKISLVQFAHSTRMLFVKLLAVVKWVKSSKKFESCAAICYLLDQQSQYFIETADRLVTISREELVMARLPAFQVTAAVDVLTQGTYLHLPTIIQERFTLKPKISPIDEANVLLRLNQVLQYRISKVASTLSPRIKGIVIKNGMVPHVVSMDDVDHSKPALPVVPDKCGPPTISLNYLLDFAIQQIYHEITVLSELLPKKLDGDRKISLVQFAHSTRMLFVKLLAVVKWVKSSKKFESCAAICYLLDQQSQYFIETADRLVTISREELVMARLPAFQVTAAVDVLTQGTYLHLPTIIQERFTLKPKISPIDEANVLLRLNQVLQYRISKVASTLSPRIKGIVIKNGMLILTVPGEFEVNLTVLGEREQTPWTLLNIKMLVEDYEIGYGAQLVHPLQLHMLHTVLQSRMDVAKNPINEVYNFLHTFAQSLQLDVLFCQASQLAAGRLRNKIVIEKYDPKERVLSIGYWVQRITKKGIGAHIRLVPQYRVTIYGDEADDTTLKVRHHPIAPDLGQLDDRTGRLSIDRLLSETLVVRCRERLLRIRKRLKAAKPLSIVLYAGAAAPCLWLPLLRDSVHTREECVVISVNMFSGRVLCSLDAIEFLPGSASELKELEISLYDGQSIDLLRKRIDRLKILLMIERYRRSVATLQVRIINENQMAPFFKKVHSLPADRICLQFIKEEHFYLVVTFVSNENLTVKMSLYLLCTLDDKVQMMELNKEKQLISAPIDGVVDIEAKTFGRSENDDVWTQSVKQ